jgi:hypothetical protein
MSPPSRDVDLQHLKALSICHYVLGVLTALFSSVFLIHLGMGIMMIASPSTISGGSEPPPWFMGWLLILFAGGFILIGWIFSALIIIAGRFLARRKHHLFCLIMAAVSCAVSVPLGTVLGVFTLIVLLRPSVKELFRVNY